MKLMYIHIKCYIPIWGWWCLSTLESLYSREYNVSAWSPFTGSQHLIAILLRYGDSPQFHVGSLLCPFKLRNKVYEEEVKISIILILNIYQYKIKLS